MVDLTAEMAGLWAALGPARGARGRVFQIVSASTGEGVSTVARELARLAAVRARRPVWLVDADLAQQEQAELIARAPDRFGALGRAARASPDGSAFYDITPPVQGKDGRPVHPSRLMTARPCLGGRLWVTRFATESLRSSQKAEPVDDPAYWDALRQHAETVIIDTPAADRNDMALTLAPLVDASIVVVAAEGASVGGPAALRDELEAAGGRIAGVVMNRSRYRPPPFLDRLIG